jgi:ABC-type protease/lipase transport system fused ATPase/permease subunit
MKITRKTLLIITAGLGVFLIVFSLIRQFTGLRLGETFEKNLFDTVLFIALGLFLYNRKLASDEKKEREAKERAEQEAAQQAAAEAESPAETDRDRPGNEDPCPEKHE